MGIKCFGACTNEKTAQGMRFYDERTGIHWKRCSTCFKKLNTTDMRCFCCNTKLRTMPIKLKNKLGYGEVKRI